MAAEKLHSNKTVALVIDALSGVGSEFPGIPRRINWFQTHEQV
jgi:hypothetical protein